MKKVSFFLIKFIRVILLCPVSVIYALITILRNYFYYTGLLKTHTFDIPVIGVGNISMGATGKTPMIEYIAGLLTEKGYKIAILSRGYKRKTKGYIELNQNSTALEAGDEPVQIKQKFPTRLVSVCKDRVYGINRILSTHPATEVILLDDAFQHRSVKPGLNILLTEYSKPFFRDFIFPSGNLREIPAGKKRAGMILITKCPLNIDEDKKESFKKHIRPGKDQKLFFSGISYGTLIPFGDDGIKTPEQNELKSYSVLCFSGIGSPESFTKYCDEQFAEVVYLHFRDHHEFSASDFEKISGAFNRIKNVNKMMITTEKDICRIKKSNVDELFRKKGIYFVPVKVFFNENESKLFDQQIMDYVRQNKKNS